MCRSIITPALDLAIEDFLSCIIYPILLSIRLEQFLDDLAGLGKFLPGLGLEVHFVPLRVVQDSVY